MDFADLIKFLPGVFRRCVDRCLPVARGGESHEPRFRRFLLYGTPAQNGGASGDAFYAAACSNL